MLFALSLLNETVILLSLLESIPGVQIKMQHFLQSMKQMNSLLFNFKNTF